MKEKKQISRVGLFGLMFALFVGFFIVGKVIFFFFQNRDYGVVDYLKTIWAGLAMDASTTAYLSILPSLLFICSIFFTKSLKSILRIYFLIITFLLSLTIIADAELYTYWGFRIDGTIFTYITSPENAAASTSLGRLAFLLILILAFSALQFFAFKKIILDNFPKTISKKRTKVSLLFIPLLGLLFVILRGGITTSTMNVGRAYYCNDTFLNHSAINPLFSILYSLSHMNQDFDSKYKFMELDEAETIFTNLMLHDSSADTVKILNTQRPNIVFVVLESFGRAVAKPLGGEKDVTPNLNKLIEEGVLFSNMYANSFRTDRGIVAVLGGYPAQPTMSILKYPSKVETLPSIPKSLFDNGYNTSFTYGGDIHFAGMSTFFLSQRVADLTKDTDFPIKDRLSKWGAPDHVALPEFEKEIMEETKEPFFKGILTLSSHEPFDVPFHKFKDPYLNSVAYTDSCLGVFINNLKQSPKWKNTLVVFVPDHDMRYPANIEHYAKNRHDIFMLWAGGAVAKPMNIDVLCNQVDIAATLLNQLGISHKEFSFSRNILNPTYIPFAFYAFPDGFGMISPEGDAIYDAGGKTVLNQSGQKTDSLLIQGKAYLQYLYHDIAKR